MAMMGRDDYAVSYGLIKSRKQKTKGVIYIEDITDKKFWESIATEHKVTLYSEQGRMITGKSKLLKICSPNQLIAIDSDFDNLCPNHCSANILFSDKKDYILETYAHGRENIVFSPECLSQILDKKFQLYLDNHDNLILAIFEKLSAIWFEPYQKFLFLFNQRKYQDDFWRDNIQFQNTECQDIALKNDFSAYQDRLSIFNYQLSLEIDDTNHFEQFCCTLSEKDFNQQNVWAFIRCHDFEKQFVMPLMKAITEYRQNQEFGYLNNCFLKSEIGSKRKEVANYFKEINCLESVLHHSFYDIYLEHAKQNDFFVKKIVGKYQAVLAIA